MSEIWDVSKRISDSLLWTPTGRCFPLTASDGVGGEKLVLGVSVRFLTGRYLQHCFALPSSALFRHIKYQKKVLARCRMCIRCTRERAAGRRPGALSVRWGGPFCEVREGGD